MDALTIALAGGTEPEAERRWLITAASALAVLDGAGTSLEAAAEASAGGGWVRTTYFDTPRFTLAGKPGGLRARIRLREYAEHAHDLHARTAMLELKLTAGGVRVKERIALELSEALQAREGALSWLAIAARSEAPGLSAWLDRLGGELRPVAMTWYRRHAFRTGNGRLRVTLDDGVRLCRPAAPGAPLLPSTNLVCATLASHVLEVKGFGPPPPALDAAIASLGAPQDFSKYESALAAVQRADAPRLRSFAGGTAARLAAARPPR